MARLLRAVKGQDGCGPEGVTGAGRRGSCGAERDRRGPMANGKWQKTGQIHAVHSFEGLGSPARGSGDGSIEVV